jgi:predicted AlkP superfamily phosphohydrolase/phosphomutase
MTNRTIVLGLDGLSWPLLNRLVEEGVMPELRALLADSEAGPMNSVRPEISPVAWTSFFTAARPCRHGIYGFTDFEPKGYDIKFNASTDVKVPPLWDWLSLRNRRCVVLNVPLTYPARPLSGVMVSGFVALDYDRAGYPSWVSDFLRRSDYALEADFERVHQDREAFQADLDRALAGRDMLFDRFSGEEWDLFVLVVTDTDRLFHFFLKEYEDQGPVTPYFLDFFRRVDALVGKAARLAEQLNQQGDSTDLVMLSDHGFAPVIEEFHVNRWLAARGYLNEVGPSSAALALDPTRIYFNGPPRFPSGKVPPSDYSRLAQAITADLIKEPAVTGVDRRSDLYDGPLAHLAPDLVIRPAEGYEFKAKFNPGDIYTESPLMGTHTFENAFYLWRTSQGEAPNTKVVNIVELGRRLFQRHGVESPGNSGDSSTTGTIIL